VCSGRTGHAEAVLVVHDPAVLPYQVLLRVFWEGHDPYGYCGLGGTGVSCPVGLNVS
jgi:peptide methionine sulfoxide reductase MsrA